ncbi:MAG: PTH2 family peptidyl-tRNA hydrolase [Oceanicoccus sp.]
MLKNEAFLRYMIIEIPMKQIIIVNDSLALLRGKLAAQVAHASLASFLSENSLQQKDWLESGMPKIALSTESKQ